MSHHVTARIRRKKTLSYITKCQMSRGKVVWDRFDASKLDDCYDVMTQWNSKGHESQKRLGCRLKTRQKKPWMIHQEFMCSFPAKSIHVSRWCNRSTFPTLRASVNRLTANFFFSTSRREDKKQQTMKYFEHSSYPETRMDANIFCESLNISAA